MCFFPIFASIVPWKTEMQCGKFPWFYFLDLAASDRVYTQAE